MLLERNPIKAGSRVGGFVPRSPLGEIPHTGPHTPNSRSRLVGRRGAAASGRVALGAVWGSALLGALRRPLAGDPPIDFQQNRRGADPTKTPLREGRSESCPPKLTFGARAFR